MIENDHPTPPSHAELDDVTESFMQAVDRVDADRERRHTCPEWCDDRACHDFEDLQPGDGLFHTGTTWQAPPSEFQQRGGYVGDQIAAQWYAMPMGSASDDPSAQDEYSVFVGLSAHDGQLSVTEARAVAAGILRAADLIEGVQR